MDEAPIIIFGMHRSGTSLLADLLQTMSVFIGQDLRWHSESHFFWQINQWLMDSAGARWDQPTPFEAFMQSAELVAYTQTRIQQILASSRKRRYGRAKPPWGWKDPVNTITLPVWLRLFPSAKLIGIQRHGVDVALSLHRREIRELGRLQARPLVRRSPFQTGYMPSARCLNSLREAFTLWEDYMLAGERLMADYSKQAYIIRYEDLVKSPPDTLQQIADFCEVKAPSGDDLARHIQADSYLAYQASDEGRSLAQQMEDRLARFGY